MKRRSFFGMLAGLVLVPIGAAVATVRPHGGISKTTDIEGSLDLLGDAFLRTPRPHDGMFPWTTEYSVKFDGGKRTVEGAIVTSRNFEEVNAVGRRIILAAQDAPPGWKLDGYSSFLVDKNDFVTSGKGLDEFVPVQVIRFSVTHRREGSA